jgi:hypothetical protein
MCSWCLELVGGGTGSAAGAWGGVDGMMVTMQLVPGTGLQVAAVLLAAQAEGGTSPLQAHLPEGAVRLALQAWQQRVQRRTARQLSARTGGGFHREVWQLFKRMGLKVGVAAGPV